MTDPTPHASRSHLTSAVEVCSECDIADCRHIRERRATGKTIYAAQPKPPPDAARIAALEAELYRLTKRAELAEEWRDHDKVRADAAEAELTEAKTWRAFALSNQEIAERNHEAHTATLEAERVQMANDKKRLLYDRDYHMLRAESAARELSETQAKLARAVAAAAQLRKALDMADAVIAENTPPG